MIITTNMSLDSLGHAEPEQIRTAVMAHTIGEHADPDQVIHVEVRVYDLLHRLLHGFCQPPPIRAEDGGAPAAGSGHERAGRSLQGVDALL